ncbi:hypothetical protein [Caballeronia sp. LZ034LL]|uniref:hypothetical protein n=1 Tax=Caballeronia sp. LZ034LL TaxID=3038567 RepID=UPI002856495E|nr:hypothetical protein [Caballeronia sp. LZ034LL]MDR5835372.1 hypothetical protein [Caballeronia sp. LZ034LL]
MSADELAHGLPDDYWVDRAWETADQKPHMLPGYHFRHPFIGFMRDVVRICRLLRNSHPANDVYVHLKVQETTQKTVVASEAAGAARYLFSTKGLRYAEEVERAYPGDKFHPYILLYLREASKLRYASDVHSTDVQLAANADFQKFSSHIENSEIDIAHLCNVLDGFFRRFACVIANEKLQTDVAKFERAAEKTRTSFMKSSAHCTRRTLSKVIHLKLERAASVPQFDRLLVEKTTGISYDKITSARKAITKIINQEIPSSMLSGRFIHLRRNGRIGYWLETYVFLENCTMEEYLRTRERLVSGITMRCLNWRLDCATIEFENYGTDEFVETLLLRCIMTMESEFYAQARTPGDSRRYFPTQRKPPSSLGDLF